MKNKIKKIILSIVIFILLVGISLTILIIKGILPNPFLDTSDLYCYRDGIKYDTYKLDKYIVFSFDKWGNLANGEKQDHLTFEKMEDAKKKFNIFKEIFDDNSIDILELKDKTLIIKGELDSPLNVENMNKKQIKERYSELGYECK